MSISMRVSGLEYQYDYSLWV